MPPTLEACDMPDRALLGKTDKRVKYREAASETERCYDCRFWTFGSCNLVEGGIEAEYTCNMFTPPLKTFPDMLRMADASGELPTSAPLDAAALRPMFFSFDQEWIAFLPKPGRYAHPLFDELDFREDRYSHILDNFNENVYKQDLPVNVEHDSIAAGAVGWIKPGGMRIAEDGSIEVKPEWTETGKALLDEDRFRYASAEVALRWQDPLSREWHTDVPVGMAICVRPHFKTDVLRPLAASERVALTLINPVAESIETPSIEEEITMPDPTPVAAVDPVKLTETPVEDAPAATATEPVTPAPIAQRTINDLSLSEVILTAEQRNLERAQFAQLTERVELAERRATTAEAAVLAERTARLTEWSKAEVLGNSADSGVAWFGSVQENSDWLLSEAITYGKDSPNVQRLIKHKRNEAHAIKNSGLFESLASHPQEPSGDVLTQVAHLTDQLRQSQPMMSKEQAESQVYKENPELYVRLLNAKK